MKKFDILAAVLVLCVAASNRSFIKEQLTINEENGRVGYDKCIDEKMKCDAKCPSDDSGEHCVENFTLCCGMTVNAGKANLFALTIVMVSTNSIL